MIATKLSIESHVQILEEYSKAYYEGNPIVTDAEYDRIEEELRQLDPQNPWFNRVRESTAVFYGQKQRHKYSFIGSIQKIHSLSESKIGGKHSVSAKLDGTSMVVYFEDGKVDCALTRGDGVEGFDVTDKYLAIAGKYDIQIPKNFMGAVRGEVVLSNRSWEEFKKRHPEAKMQRNSGTGLINSKEVTEDTKLLDFVIYEIEAMSIEPSEDYSNWTEFEMLNKLDFGYPIAPHIIVDEAISSEDELISCRNAWSQIYPLDGIVLNKTCRWDIFNNDGLLSTASEKEAYKFEAESKKTTIEEIEWTLQKSGRLIPVVKVSPVELSGAVVRRATANNAFTVISRGIKPGLEVRIQRANEVIPRVYFEELKHTMDGEAPKVCPHCGKELTWVGMHLKCLNEHCSELERLRTRNFLAVCGGQKIKGVGDSIYDLIQKDTLVETLQYLQAGVFYGVTGHQQKLISQIKDNIFQGITLKTLMTAVNPENIGDKQIGRLIQEDNWDWLHEYFVREKVLVACPNGFTQKATRALLEVQKIAIEYYTTLSFLMIPVKWETSEVKKVSPNARGFCVTGGLSVSRGAFCKMCEAKGWVMTSIKKAEVLITEDPNSGSAKNKEAQALGKKVVTENEFIEQYLNK